MYKFYLFLLVTIVVSSCSESISDDEPETRTSVDAIYVATNMPIAANDVDADNEENLMTNSFDSNSILYFSQLGTTLTPNFSDDGETAQPYCYQYKYNSNPAADWDTGYNFKCVDSRKSFDWSVVPTLGSVGNAFSFFAMYYPGDNVVKWEVQKDQSEQSNFIKSDIMGAYHATSTLYTRLRFNLFHLMVYLKVTIYVPTHKSSNDNDNYNYSGFEENALVGAYVLNANTMFDIDWRAVRSSDIMAPLTQSKESKANIKMFSHPTTGDIEQIDVRNYYNGGDLIEDDVRAYTFSVIFPSQPFGDNFLCFALKDIDNTTRYFYFSGSQIVGDSGNYSLSQGTLQELSLYLPRNSNETILLGAKILSWKDSVTDMTVSKDT